MKKLILLLLLPLFGLSQYVPLKVEDIIRNKASISKPIDTVYFDNHLYVFQVKGDSSFVRWDLIKSQKLFVDGYKATGVSLFLINMTSFIILPKTNLERSKYYHIAAGFAAGLGCNLLIYKLTHKKWLAFAGGILGSAIVGAGKEWYDSKTGGKVSGNDILITTAGGINGSAWVIIPIGHKQLVKKHSPTY